MNLENLNTNLNIIIKFILKINLLFLLVYIILIIINFSCMYIVEVYNNLLIEYEYNINFINESLNSKQTVINNNINQSKIENTLLIILLSGIIYFRFF